METTRKLEKVAIDVMKLEQENRVAAVLIDYYTRVMMVRLIEDRTTKSIKKVLNTWIEENGLPEEIVTDNAQEFTSEEMWKYLIDRKIKHRRVSVESHQSNGRVERVIRTIREALVKIERGQPLEEKLREIEEGYNNKYHKGVKCAPNGAWENGDTEELRERNSKDGAYAKQFKKLAREEFEVGDKVRVASSENMGNQAKAYKGRFIEEGVITDKCGSDSYLVRGSDGRFTKRRHYDLRRMVEGT